jgi:hypothetical protein
MENNSNLLIPIPSSHFEILEFIQNNRDMIMERPQLIHDLIHRLDVLLKNASCMVDLHNDTKILLEAIKLEYDTFLKEIRNELTLDRLFKMVDSKIM